MVAGIRIVTNVSDELGAGVVVIVPVNTLTSFYISKRHNSKQTFLNDLHQLYSFKGDIDTVSADICVHAIVFCFCFFFVFVFFGFVFFFNWFFVFNFYYFSLRHIVFLMNRQNLYASVELHVGYIPHNSSHFKQASSLAKYFFIYLFLFYSRLIFFYLFIYLFFYFILFFFFFFGVFFFFFFFFLINFEKQFLL
jgi:hypothetical protein